MERNEKDQASSDKYADGTSGAKTSFSGLREKINGIDQEILSLLSRRRDLSVNIIKAKDAEKLPIRDQKREQELMVELIKLGRQKGLDAHFVTSIYHRIINDSLRIQQEYLQSTSNSDEKRAGLQRIAFLGIEGSYSYMAAGQHFSHESERLSYVGCLSFEDIVKTVESGRAEYGILPVENTTSGGINEVYDLLVHTQLPIVGEEKLKIEHCLIGVDGADLKDIKRIYSHSQALSQSSRFVESLTGCELQYLGSTAEAVRRIKESGSAAEAAIGSRETAEKFGLTVIKDGISNHKENYTRFLIIGRKPLKVDSRIPCKTSLVMATAHAPGSLAEALVLFRKAGINLTKLESRPIPDNPWEEMFYLDFEGSTEDIKVKETLEELTRVTRFIKVLGSYPSADLPDTKIPSKALLSLKTSPEANKDKTESGTLASSNGKSAVKQKSKKGYRLVSREHKPDNTVIAVKGVKIGGSDFVVIAGPCSVESRDLIMSCARHAKEHGAQILRGGCFKPRTSPYSFQGLGYEGLDYMVEAGETYSLPIITEVLTPEDVDGVSRKADILQIGARNMQNFSLLKAVGRVNRPVMLKRGLMASIEELLYAAEYILSHGNQQVFLCERGIRTFETSTRNTLDLSAIPILKELTHLPVFVDPSHAVGERDLVRPMALAGKAAGAHGMMVEFHPEPEKALSDGPQALYYPQFASLMEEIFS